MGLGGPANWSPTHSTGLQPIQLVPKNCLLQKSQYRSLKSKNSKNLVHLFSNFDSGRTSQLVPNPFNWSPITIFYRNLSIGRSNQKNKKNLVHLFSNFDSGRTLPTSQLVRNPFKIVFLQSVFFQSVF